MFRIRRIYDDVLPVNQTAPNEVRHIFREQFPDALMTDWSHSRNVCGIRSGNAFAQFCMLRKKRPPARRRIRHRSARTNLPLPEFQTGEQYQQCLKKAIKAIQRFAPAFLVIALGLDPAKGAPTGTW